MVRSLRCALAGLLLTSAAARAQVSAYDFSDMADLAAGAVNGQNVGTPVPGFELLLLKDGRFVYHRAFGAWSIGRLAAADSATKTISGAVIMSLTDSSVQPFSLAARVNQYVPQFVGGKQNITIAQCFSHMSGLRDSGTVADATITLQQAAIDIADDFLRFLPGTTFSYGGTSMHAAGAAAEVAGGATWNTLYQQRIAGPLGLVQTRYVLSSPDNPRIAGGCESTAAEFAVLMEMLRRGGLHGSVRVLQESSVQAMFTRQTPVGVPVANSPLGDSADYGVGVWLDQRGAQGQLIGALAAGARGFSSWIDFDDGMVGVFATDLTLSGNIQPLVDLIRDAAQAAIRSPIACPADFNRSGLVSVQDIFDFLAAFFAGAADADLNAMNGVSVQDLFDYLEAYFAGCP